MEQSQLERLATVGIIAAEFGHTLPALLGVSLAKLERMRRSLEQGKGYQDEEVKQKLEDGIATIKLVGRITDAIESYMLSGGVNMRPYDTNRGIEEAVLPLKRIYGEQIKFVPNPGAGLPEIELMDGFLALCVYNALRNSMAAGAKSFEYGTEAAEGLVKVSFVDDGCGIQPDHLAKIVDPFVSFRTGGRGIGLATTNRLMELCGGKLEISSPVKDSHGTSVSLYIPAAKEQAAVKRC